MSLDETEFCRLAVVGGRLMRTTNDVGQTAAQLQQPIAALVLASEVLTRVIVPGGQKLESASRRFPRFGKLPFGQERLPHGPVVNAPLRLEANGLAVVADRFFESCAFGRGKAKTVSVREPFGLKITNCPVIRCGLVQARLSEWLQRLDLRRVVVVNFVAPALGQAARPRDSSEPRQTRDRSAGFAGNGQWPR